MEDRPTSASVDFISGLIGGGAGVLAGHPFDTVKVRLQVQSDNKYRGIIHCFTTICHKEGPLSLFRGVSSPLAGIGVINGIVFCAFGNVLRQFEDQTSLKSIVLAGSSAGIAQTIISSPMELVKLRIQVQTDSRKLLHVFFKSRASRMVVAKKPCPYTSPLHCAIKILKTGGLRELYKGYWLTLLRDTSGFASYFTIYHLATNYMSEDGPASLSSVKLFMAGGAAGMLSWFWNYPIDILKTRYQADGVDPKRIKYSSVMDCVKKTYAEHGLRTFTQGLGSTMLRAFPTNAVTFLTVEWVLRWYALHVKNRPIEKELRIWEERHLQFILPLPEAGATFLDPSCTHFVGNAGFRV